MPRKKLWGIFILAALLIAGVIFTFFVPIASRDPLGEYQWLCAVDFQFDDEAIAHEAAHEKFHLLLGELSSYHDAGKTINIQRFIDYSCYNGTEIVYKLYL